IDQLLIGLQHRKRIDPELGGDCAHRWQRISFLEHAVENHMHTTIAKLAIDWLSVIPFTIHSVLQTALLPSASGPASIGRCGSYGDIVNYITIAHASLFLQIFRGNFYAAEEQPAIATTSLILPTTYRVNNPSDTRCDPVSPPTSGPYISPVSFLILIHSWSRRNFSQRPPWFPWQAIQAGKQTRFDCLFSIPRWELS